MAKRKTTKRPKSAARRGGSKPAKKRVQSVPAGYHTATPYLTVNDGAGALDFYTRAFGARVTERMPGHGGKVMHAEFRIGDSVIMLSDEFPGMSTCKAPTTLGGRTGSVMLYVPNVDAAFKRATDAGAKALMPPTDMFWGDRFGKLEDPFGNEWAMATHKEDVKPAELKKRVQAMAAQMGSKA